MEFKQEIADEMLADPRWKGAITEKMIRVWKTRNTIPNQYFNQKYVALMKKGDDKAFQVKDPYYNEAFILKTPLTEVEKAEQEKILKILKSNSWKGKGVFEKAGIAYSFFQDATRTDEKKRVDLRSEHILSLKKQINDVRNQVKKLMSNLEAKTQFTFTNVELIDELFEKNKDLINYTVIINSELYVSRMYVRINKNGSTYDNNEITHILHYLKIFLFESQI